MKLRDYMGGDWLNKESSIYNKISTINNGVDVKAISNAVPDAELLSLKKDRKAILMVAGFRNQKDQNTVVKALNILDKEKFEVWFAGIGDRMDDVKQLVVSLGITDNVRFLGLRTDIPNVLKAADFIVMSSHWEGLSLSNVEGMSAHKPFIASDVNGLRGVTKGYGVLFPHEDATILAQVIKSLAGDETYYHEIAERCYNRASEFDISKMVVEYNFIYHTQFENGKR